MATINDFGIPEVGTGVLHPKLKHKWRVTFANLGGGTETKPVSMQAKTITRPNLQFQEVELHRYNTKAYVASKHSWEPLQLTIEDDITNTATKVIQDQLQKQQFLIGAEGPWLASASTGSDYKFTVYLDLLNGNEAIVEKWTYEGVFIAQCDWGDMDYSNGEAVDISLTLRFDHARQDISGTDTLDLGTALGS